MTTDNRTRSERRMTSSLGLLVGQTLTWVPTAALKERYDLIAPDKTTLATLDMKSWSWTSKAHARVPEGTLFMQREGWFGQKVAISSGEQGPLLATYHSKGRSGQLVFPDGGEFRWSTVNFWGTQKAWTDPTGHTAYVHFSGGGFSRTSTVVIDPQAAEIPELALLLVLGLYNILIERHAAAAAASS